MVDLDEIIRELNSLKQKIIEIKESIKYDDLKLEKEDLSKRAEAPDFWNDPSSNEVYSRIKYIDNILKLISKLEKDILDSLEMASIINQDYDDALAKDLEKTLKTISSETNDLEISTLLSGKYDNSNAIVTLHPGAGGTESQDWVQMLYRMYTKWASQNGFGVKELDYLEGDEAGIKSVTFLVSGEYAYGYLKSEIGVHRLIRISPFDSGGRRHTSFASCEVLPEIKNDNEIVINNDDLRIDTFRASGAGGQHINKTDSAVRITHIPTGIVVSCQSERSQTMNKETAMKMLKSKLLALEEEKQKEKMNKLKGKQMDIAWGSQIRSYIFCPYTLVKDHRTNYEVGNVDSVMDGDLNGFMQEYLKLLAKNK